MLRSPFSFLFAGSSKDERIAAYVIREHERGRRLSELARLLERPEVVQALGRAAVAETKQELF